jgi:hypothetical protein
MPKMHAKVSLETKNQVLQEVPKTIFMTPICVCSTTNSRGLAACSSSRWSFTYPLTFQSTLQALLKPSVSPLPYKWIPNTITVALERRTTPL